MTITAPRRSLIGGLRGRIMRLAEQVTTPLVPADYLDVIDPLRSATTLRGRIVTVHPETADAATVVIKPGRGWRTHTPGQYVRIGVDVNGVRQWRTYSLTSEITRPDGCLCITVKAIGDGIVSNHLVRRAPIGTVLHLDQAAGDFTLDAPATAKLLFVTAGSGITPVMGMLRNMPADRHHDVVVVHCAPTAADVIFGEELRALAARGRIRLVEIHTRTTGRLDIAGIENLVGDFTDRLTWACGPADLLDDIENHWATSAITAKLRTERFRFAAIATGDGGTVTFSKTRSTIDATGAQSLLDAGETAGVLMPSGCRMGICFGCVVPLRQGAVRDLRNGELTTAAPGDGVIIQTCISAAAGACEIEL
jgi:ferredoxin-NADP reductase